MNYSDLIFLNKFMIQFPRGPLNELTQHCVKTKLQQVWHVQCPMTHCVKISFSSFLKVISVHTCMPCIRDIFNSSLHVTLHSESILSLVHECSINSQNLKSQNRTPCCELYLKSSSTKMSVLSNHQDLIFYYIVIYINVSYKLRGIYKGHQ